jgi:hypothetical protein
MEINGLKIWVPGGFLEMFFKTKNSPEKIPGRQADQRVLFKKKDSCLDEFSIFWYKLLNRGKRKQTENKENAVRILQVRIPQKRNCIVLALLKKNGIHI